MNIVEAVTNLFSRLWRERVWIGIVDSTSGNLIKVRRNGQAAADSQFYAAASGLAATVVANDEVLVMAVGSSYMVVAKKVI